MMKNQENKEISPLQCRMARAGLKLGVRELGALADVSPNTVARFERGENLHRRTIKAIQGALMSEGAEFYSTESGEDAVSISKKLLR